VPGSRAQIWAGVSVCTEKFGSSDFRFERKLLREIDIDALAQSIIAIDFKNVSR
jgi:hypothetical protein